MAGDRLTVKFQNYTLEEVFEKNLLILIPFHIFVYENRFLVCNEDAERLEELLQVYKRIAAHLHALAESGTIEGYDAYLIASMTVKVAEHLAKDYENVVKGVKKAVMDDGYIDYPGRKEYLAAMEKGRVEGRVEGILSAYVSFIKEGLISLAEAAKRLNISEEQIKNYM